jgi:glycine/D-amino acid oxidase-like deaminating enzyme
MITRDVLVVGGGILGCSTAWHLARRGLRVTVIEREDAVGRGSTSRSTAIIRQRYSHPAAMALALEGLRTWESWPERVPADADGRRAALRQVGVLFLLPSGEPTTRLLHAAMRDVGIAVELLDPRALLAAFPALHIDADEAVEGLFEPEGGYVDDPTRATADVARAAREAGADLHLGQALAEVTTRWHDSALEVRGVRLRDGTTFEAPVVINCAGPHSGWLNLVARSPLALATTPLRQAVVDARAPGLAAASARLPVIADLVLGFYLRPDPACVRIGAVWSRDETEFLADPDGADPVVSRELIDSRIATARRRVPALEVESARGIVGVYDVTVQDWYPIVDRTDTRGYFVAIGTSGAWFKAGPVIGQLAAEMVTASLEGRDTDAQPLEVMLPLTGYRFPMTLFSRRRPPIALSYGGGVLG